MTEPNTAIKTYFRQQAELYPEDIYLLSEGESAPDETPERLHQLEKVCLANFF